MPGMILGHREARFQSEWGAARASEARHDILVVVVSGCYTSCFGHDGFRRI